MMVAHPKSALARTEKRFLGYLPHVGRCTRKMAITLLKSLRACLPL